MKIREVVNTAKSLGITKRVYEVEGLKLENFAKAKSFFHNVHGPISYRKEATIDPVKGCLVIELIGVRTEGG